MAADTACTRVCERKFCVRWSNPASGEQSQNRAALTLYQSAERYLKEHLGNDITLKLKAWKGEVAALISEKDSLYDEIHRLKAEAQEAEAVKKCVEQAVQPEQIRAKTQSKRYDMEL